MNEAFFFDFLSMAKNRGKKGKKKKYNTRNNSLSEVTLGDDILNAITTKLFIHCLSEIRWDNVSL